MSVLSELDYRDTLKTSGFKEGDAVLLTSRLFAIGAVELSSEAKDDENAIPQFYFDNTKAVIGQHGTLIASTAFEDYARFGTPFVREESPSRSGVLSEYVRVQKGTVRSCHPIMSLSASGGEAEALCGSNHFDAFGYSSPWAKMHRSNAKLLMLGLGLPGGGVFVHYIEQLFGVPYQYNKVYDTDVFSNGEKVNGTFTMNVRYLDFSIQNDFSKLEEFLLQKKVVHKVPLGRSWFLHCSTQDLVDATCDFLQKDRYGLLKDEPAFRLGEIPYDGNTGKMKSVYHTADRDFEGE